MGNHTRKKGGAFLAKGASGCVFGKPPLKCKGENSRRDDTYVTKYMDLYGAMLETKQSEDWHAIDPHNKFSITPIKLCEFDKSNIKKSNSFEKCKGLKSLVRTEGLILYKDGGIDLLELKVKPKNYAYFFGAFYDLLNGLSIAHENNLIHNDIKAENILAERLERKIHLRFIDFGLSYRLDEQSKIESYKNGGYKNFFYLFWPFEIKFLDKEILNNDEYYKKQFIKFKNDIFTSLKSFVPTSIFINPETKKIYTPKDLRTIYNKLDLEKYLDKIDVYAFGITLSQFIFYYFRHVQTLDLEGNTVMKVYLSDKKEPVDINLLDVSMSETLTEEIIEWHKKVAENITGPMFSFVAKLIDFRPDVRYTSKQAAQEYKKFIPAIYKYLKDDKIIEKTYSSYTRLLDKTPEIENQPTPSPPYELYKLFGNNENEEPVKRRRNNNNNFRVTKKQKLNNNNR